MDDGDSALDSAVRYAASAQRKARSEADHRSYLLLQRTDSANNAGRADSGAVPTGVGSFLAGHADEEASVVVPSPSFQEGSVASDGDLLSLSGTGVSRFTQRDESDRAEVVVLHAPQVANWMGGLHPNGSLYERPVRLEASVSEHKEFRRKLEAEGVEVVTVREILLRDCATDVLARLSLENFAFESLKYSLISGASADDLNAEERYYLSDKYKRECVDKMDDEQLVDVILTRPTVFLRKSDRDTELITTSYTFNPLVNLVFTRDQQLTTNRGIVIGRLASSVRRTETVVMKYCWTKLGLPIVGEVYAPGRVEGGDFMPAGNDLCFIGIGLRSNVFAAKQLMAEDLFGTRRVAVVKDFFDYDQQRMHLDTVCNVVDRKLAIALEDILGERSSKRRLVDEYVKDADGKYSLFRHDVEFGSYLQGEGFKIIRLTDRMQRDYGCNALNLGNGVNVFVDIAAAKQVARSRHFHGRILHVDFRHMADMFGSVHCCSQVISRVRPSTDFDTDGSTYQDTQRELMDSAIAEARNARVDLRRAKIPRQSSRKVLMVAPTNFCCNLSRTALEAGVSPNLPYIRSDGHVDHRALVRALMHQYCRLHELLTVDLGVEVHLLGHDIEEDIPHATFCGDVFSVHPKGDSAVGVLYSMHETDRRGEKRRQVFEDVLEPLVTEWVNLSPCETGTLEITRNTISSSHEYTRGHCAGEVNGVDSVTRAFEARVVQYDRRSHVMYVGLGEFADAAVAELLAAELGYRLVTYAADASHPSLFVGTNFAIVCSTVVGASVLAELKASGKAIVEISDKQMRRNCADVIEVLDQKDEPVLILSTRAHDALEVEQQQALAKCSRLRQVDMFHLEFSSGRSIGGLVAALF